MQRTSPFQREIQGQQMTFHSGQKFALSQWSMKPSQLAQSGDLRNFLGLFFHQWPPKSSLPTISAVSYHEPINLVVYTHDST